MTYLTKQDIFHIVKNHLLAQNARAVSDKGFCMYRTDSGKKCAFGVLIPDSLYDPDMESKNAGSVLGQFANLSYLREHGDLITDLQQVHDFWPPEDWKVGLAFIAGKHKVNYINDLNYTMETIVGADHRIKFVTPPVTA